MNQRNRRATIPAENQRAILVGNGIELPDSVSQ